MAENTQYFDAITGARALLLTEEEALAGQTLLSLETMEDVQEDGFFIYCIQHFPAWLRSIRLLSPAQQELILSYYLLGKTQLTLGRVHQSTQTICSFKLRMAFKLAAAYLLMGGPPSQEWMYEVLVKAGLEYKFDKQLKAPLSEIIAEYVACRNFAKIAFTYDLHQPDIRRCMRKAYKELLGADPEDSSQDSKHIAGGPVTTPEATALGVYIYDLIADKGQPVRHAKKMTRCVVFTDPPCLGDFRVAVDDPGFDSWFVSQANR